MADAIGAGRTFVRKPSEEAADRPLTEPHPGRLAAQHPRRSEILTRHAAALEAGEPGYLDPDTDLFVLTAAYLLARGHCCDRGCRHCPYVGRCSSIDSVAEATTEMEQSQTSGSGVVVQPGGERSRSSRSA